jgi:hypothetical protein
MLKGKKVDVVYSYVYDSLGNFAPSFLPSFNSRRVRPGAGKCGLQAEPGQLCLESATLTTLQFGTLPCSSADVLQRS